MTVAGITLNSNGNVLVRLRYYKGPLGPVRDHCDHSSILPYVLAPLIHSPSSIDMSDWATDWDVILRNHACQLLGATMSTNLLGPGERALVRVRDHCTNSSMGSHGSGKRALARVRDQCAIDPWARNGSG